MIPTTLSLLHLEDDLLDAELVHRALKSGHLMCEVSLVTCLSDFSAAISDDTYDLIISDYNLPDGNGLQAFKLAQHKAPNTPFVLVTGALGEELAIETIKRGVDDYVLKSNLPRLVATVPNVIEKARQKWEKKLALEELRAGEAKYRLLFEANPHPMWAYDRDNLAFLAVNDAAVAHYGYSREEFLAMTIKDIRPPEDVSRLQKNIINRTSGLDRAGVWRHLTKDGRLLAVEIISHTMTFDGHRAEIVLAHDISDRLKAEKALSDRNIELQRGNRILEQFNYAVSHELKTPLVTIESSLGLIQSSLPATMDPNLTRVFGYARTAARQLNDLLDSLLLMSQNDTVNSGSEAAPFRVLVQDAVDQLARENKLEGIRLTIAEEGPELCGDLNKLGQIWLHLIGNAAKYKGDQQHPAIDIGAEQIDHNIQFFVRDNGKGIERAYQGKIFGLFNKFDKTSDGTGLGLTLVQRAVEYYGGTIRVESAGLGKGSCFRFTLPGAIKTRDPQ
ncbi:sensor histidine kinase [Pelovirga terrestris]|uniref:histidine kinase n=1 Tax=Pelovirga terrestris TaxID=2771352 RepID=A0A8J6URF0_9BACT|nr:ATP-binding protein [Pelovirga terrestris]MBD1401236.1 PAS domain S-box protein [Pelovirga terrestris]